MNVIVNGTLLGLGYCLIAVGMSFILGVAKVFDLVYASYYLIAAYIVVMLVHIIGPYISIWLIFLIGIVAAIAVALATHYFLVLPLRKQPTSVLVSTIAVAMVVQEILIFQEGATPVYLPGVIKGATPILGVWVVNTKLLVAAVTIMIMACLWLLLTRTRLGLAIRATAEQPEAMQLVGGNIRLIWLASASLAAGLGGVASLLLGSIYPPHPYLWLDLLLIAFAVMALGGMGNIWACLPAGLILGISEAAFAVYVPSGGILKRSVGMIIIVLVLVLRPNGLFGVKGWEEQST
jgi:branched-chain amino acid transport system permease protein